MSRMHYLYQDYRINTGVGAVAPISQVVGGQQRLTAEAAKAVHLLLSNKVAGLTSSVKVTSEGFVPLPGYDETADFWTYLFYVATPAPEGATPVATKAGQVLLVNVKDAQDNIMGTPQDLNVVVAKDAQVALALSQVGSDLAVLPSFAEATSKKEEKKGLQPIAIVGALVGGGVGFLVGGPVGAIVGGIGTGVLVQQVAAA